MCASLIFHIIAYLKRKTTREKKRCHLTVCNLFCLDTLSKHILGAGNNYFLTVCWSAIFLWSAIREILGSFRQVTIKSFGAGVTWHQTATANNCTFPANAFIPPPPPCNNQVSATSWSCLRKRCHISSSALNVDITQMVKRSLRDWNLWC